MFRYGIGQLLLNKERRAGMPGKEIERNRVQSPGFRGVVISAFRIKSFKCRKEAKEQTAGKARRKAETGRLKGVSSWTNVYFNQEEQPPVKAGRERRAKERLLKWSWTNVCFKRGDTHTNETAPRERGNQPPESPWAKGEGKRAKILLIQYESDIY